MTPLATIVIAIFALVVLAAVVLVTSARRSDAVSYTHLTLPTILRV